MEFAKIMKMKIQKYTENVRILTKIGKKGQER